MLRIEQITDTDTLRQAALLLDRENRRLHDKIRELADEIARLKGQDASAAQLQLEFLKELLARRERALFGDKSERRGRQADEATSDPASSPRSGHGPKAQPKLPIVEQVHELDPADRTCPKCGEQLDEMAGQTENSEEITVVERGFVLVHHRRKKYRCSCNGHVETAPAPVRLASRPDRRGRRYSIDFAVEVAIGKYLDHLPLERQARIMRREGLEVDSQTLWDQIEGLARPLKPTLDALLRRLCSGPVLGADETWWRLMQGRGSKRWWVWSLTGQDAVVYRILDSRSQAAAREVLGDYDGIVIADGYSVYDALARAGPESFTLVNCWSHVRRKLIEAEPFEPDRCKEALDLIRDLYAVERECPSRHKERRSADVGDRPCRTNRRSCRAGEGGPLQERCKEACRQVAEVKGRTIMTTLLAALAILVSCAIGHPTMTTATSADDASTMVVFVGDSKTQKMLPDVKLLLVSDGEPASDIGTTDLNGRASVPLSRLRLSGSRVLLFCRDGYFCGAIRVDEPSFFEYREHFIQLAPFALR